MHSHYELNVPSFTQQQVIATLVRITLFITQAKLLVDFGAIHVFVSRFPILLGTCA